MSSKWSGSGMHMHIRRFTGSHCSLQRGVHFPTQQHRGPSAGAQQQRKVAAQRAAHLQRKRWFSQRPHGSPRTKYVGTLRWHVLKMSYVHVARAANVFCARGTC